MVPLIELRGAIPIAAGMGLPFVQYYIIASVEIWFLFHLSISLPERFLFGELTNLLLETFYLVFRKGWKRWKKKLQETAGKGLFVALLLFVGIPLPGTGAWTGTLAASIF